MNLGLPVELRIVRTDRRKTLLIEVDNPVVTVKVPKTLSEERLEALLMKRRIWIKDKLEKQEEMPPLRPKEYVNGESFAYLGKTYRLKIIDGSNDDPVKLRKGYLEVPVANEEDHEGRESSIKDSLTEWYSSHALSRLKNKCSRYAKVLGVEPGSIKVDDYKTRWGSCSSSGNLSFNWRVILAPHSIVDYVVVHELCHILEHNHSDKYWKHVANIIPNYKECREWLKRHGAYLLV
ncbi:M48 family metallopeptidase [Opitutales bacterium]|nr:M48 family metallopeptidase [Opitutales bacterium]